MYKPNCWKLGCAVSLLGAMAAVSPAQMFDTSVVFKTLVNFNGADGEFPYAGLVQGTDGNLYGTTQFGGLYNYGTVFRLTPSGTLTTIYSFCAQMNCTDGGVPYGGLVLGTDGNFYGTTYQEGAMSYGSVFKITSAGKLTTLHSFGGTDGANPVASLIQATDGSFYGTTYGGGANDEGTVFKMTPSGALTTLYSFCSQSGCTDGKQTYAGVIQGADGNFYGTTLYDGVNGGGTIFRITPGGTLTTLYNFCSQPGCTDGTRRTGRCSKPPMATSMGLLGTAAPTTEAQSSKSLQPAP